MGSQILAQGYPPAYLRSCRIDMKHQHPWSCFEVSSTQPSSKAYFTDIPQCWDNPQNRTNSPESKHKSTKGTVWIESWYNPGWADDIFRTKETTIKGMERAKASSGQAWSNSEDLMEGHGKPSCRAELQVNANNVLVQRGLEMLSLEEALTSLERMLQPPSVDNFTCILHKCREKKNLVYTKLLHACLCKHGVEDHISFGNYIVPMLVQVGSICDAQQVFDRLLYRNVYAWTSLIIGYIEFGEAQHALNMFQKMQKECVYPSKYTYVALLKACARLKDAERGREMHAEISRKGLDTDFFICNTLVDMYAKCGSLAKAQESFDRLTVRDVVPWNALISGYAELGLSEEALKCFKQMQLEGVSPNVSTFVCSLKACGNIGAIDKGQEIHAEITRKGMETDLFVGSTLVDMYAKCGSLVRAWDVFDKLPLRSVVSWNILIAGYAEHGLGEEALECFKQMQSKGVSPNALTFVCSLKACGSIGAIEKGREVHAEITRKGLERDLVVGSTLVDMYAKCGSLAKAREAFDRLMVRNVVSWTALIAGYAEYEHGEQALNCFEQMQLEGISPNSLTFVCCLKACGSSSVDKGQEIHAMIARKGLERDLFVGSALVDMYARCSLLTKAQEVFDKLPVRDAVLWNTLFSGYAEHCLGEKALECFKQMQLEGIYPDAVTFVYCLKSCGSIGAIQKGREIHSEIARKGFERELFVGSTLVDMYAKCGSLARAQEVFHKLSVRNVVSWNAIITGYAQLGDNEVVFHMLETMRREGMMPDRVTFLGVLTVCSNAGLVDKGLKYFEAMSKDCGINPTIDHHICVVDLLGRAGQLEEAVAIVRQMPFHPNLVVWHTVLAACQKWGNVELGKHAFEYAVQLDEKDAAAYVLMSNICADAYML